jgi:hypothetical protein
MELEKAEIQVGAISPLEQKSTPHCTFKHSLRFSWEQNQSPKTPNRGLALNVIRSKMDAQKQLLPRVARFSDFSKSAFGPSTRQETVLGFCPSEVLIKTNINTMDRNVRFSFA